MKKGQDGVPPSHLPQIADAPFPVPQSLPWSCQHSLQGGQRMEKDSWLQLRHPPTYPLLWDCSCVWGEHLLPLSPPPPVLPGFGPGQMITAHKRAFLSKLCMSSNSHYFLLREIILRPLNANVVLKHLCHCLHDYIHALGTWKL